MKTVSIMSLVLVLGLLMVGFPVMSVMRSGADGVLTKMGPGVTADVLRDEIAKARQRVARAGASINTLDRQIEEMKREVSSIETDLPQAEHRLRVMAETLRSVGDAEFVKVNGRKYDRSDVEADVADAIERHRMLLERRSSLTSAMTRAADQISRMRRERGEAFNSLAEMTRRVETLEADARIADATATAANTTYSVDHRGLQSRLERFARSVDEQRAIAQGLNMESGSGRVAWDDRDSLLARLNAQLGGDQNKVLASSAETKPVSERIE